MNKLSLRSRLIISFLSVATGIWIVAGFLSWRGIRGEMDEFFDTYQVLLAKQFATADWRNVRSDTQRIADNLVIHVDEYGSEDDDALGFAVFAEDGNMIFNDGENGRYFVYDHQPSGFSEQYVRGKEYWRIFWLPTEDGSHMIAVGQEIEFRDDAAYDLVFQSFFPWLFGLLILAIAAVYLVYKELLPLKVIEKNLSGRSPGDLSALSLKHQPKEIKPLLSAMNTLFSRIQNMIDMERSFVSNSAHELRTPLTALKVQLEVALMSGKDKKAREEALANLGKGIDRSARLVEQLLTLSRLENMTSDSAMLEPANWDLLIKDVLDDYKKTIKEKKIVIKKHMTEDAPVKQGNVLLLSLLFRNLIDNALRYGADGSEIQIEIAHHALRVTNIDSFVPEKHLKQLGERFYRLPGQKQAGSGLGLSIVKRIAGLHGLSVSCENTFSGFAVTVSGKSI